MLVMDVERTLAIAHVKVEEGQMPLVWVEDDASIKTLWQNGFFGKGMLSRSNPSNLSRLLSHHTRPSSSSSSSPASSASFPGFGENATKKRSRAEFHLKDALKLKRGSPIESPLRPLVERIVAEHETDPLILGFEDTIFLLESRLIRLKRETTRFLPDDFAAILKGDQRSEECLKYPQVTKDDGSESNRGCDHEDNDNKDRLIVSKEREESFVGLEEAWKLFCHHDPILPITFAVYRFYRNKGWV